MRIKMLALACVGALALSACETTGPTGSDGYRAPHQTRLSQCTRNALIGAGIGAAVGAVAAGEDRRGEGALGGAAIGGLGTYGVCRVLSAREQQRVEQNYYNSLNSNRAVSDSWQSDAGAPRNLSVSAPQPAQGYGGECKTVNATISEGSTRQQMPQETFCRNASGQWVPA
ncbi:MAG: hypothetical protein ABW199_08635 [Caulobacterales bacterium]